MKRGFAETLALIGAGLAALVALPTHAQTTGVGPYYATPSWDQTLPAATRFIVLSNFNSEAVLDRETGLVWQQNPFRAGNTWAAAMQDLDFGCIAKTTGGRSGWRLPRLEELQSLTI